MTPKAPPTSHITRIESMDISVGLLREHPQHLDMPLAPEQFQTMCENIAAQGITTRLLVQKAPDGFYEVLAGNQRLKAAKAIAQQTVPCDVISTDDPVTVMLSDNAIGRPRTKSAIALQVFLYHREMLVAGEDAKAKQVAGLKKGADSRCLIIRQRENIGDFDEKVSARTLSDKYGFNAQLLNDLTDMWRMCHASGDMKLAMSLWGKVVEAIASGEVSTARAKTGLAGRQGTLGKKRNAADWGGLIGKSSVTLGNAWNNWAQIAESDRDIFYQAFTSALEHIPEDGVVAIAETLPKWSAGQVKTIAEAAAKHLGYRLVKTTKE